MPSKVKITFCGGVDEVGGNQVFFEDSGYNVKLFLDFGINFVKYANHFDPHEEPRSPSELTDLYLLPKENKLSIKNLYSKFYIFDHEKQNYIQKKNKCKDLTDPPTNIDGILISHPHRDHYYGISMVNRNIPIYTGVVTQRIIKAYSEASKSVMSNFYEGLLWKLFRTRNVIEIKGLRIFPVHVDHSIPAAYGFIIESSEGIVVYSGDFRMHGPLSNMTIDLIDKTNQLKEEHNSKHPDDSKKSKKADLKINTLICEGTQINKGAIESEEMVENELRRLMANNPFDYFLVKYNRLDWDRFRSFNNIAKEFDWNYIIAEKDAYFYYLLNNKAMYDTMKDPNILENDNIYILLRKYDRYPWQTKIRNIFNEKGKNHRLIHYDDLNNFDKNFFLFITIMSHRLKNNLPSHLNGAFISSDIDPYSEEYFDNSNTIIHKLKKIGIPAYRIHASGHAKPHDIINFVLDINPLRLIPIHTDNQEFFKKLFRNRNINVKIPEKYMPIDLTGEL
ncbi:MAG: hypothetical protein GF317_16095 [Candidatus Lokiarchaeota archaeon]|nr:hypothetical protein [Candidatus Lokiarchaeota archaeon]MBD3201056.1 hypothetical protein [Candidatus Lokiarchaeota archaeon]